MFYPYGNPHANETLSWGAEPRLRGTYSILSSCIITIALCVWTAVHLNIPEYGRVMPQIGRKLFWMLIGLIAPEIVAWVAFQQLQEAKRIRNDMRKMFGQAPVPTTVSKIRSKLAYAVENTMGKSSATTTDDIDLEAPDIQTSQSADRKSWTLVHGHYVAMGGFAVDVSDAPHIFPPQKSTTRFLTHKGLKIIIQLAPDLVPDLMESEIQDKSKANGFAKTLVCIQALWFCTQIIVRAASRLTISVLELNTFAHALCTLTIYFLWWDKPLDITEPTIVRGEAAHPAIALFSVLQDSSKNTACVISPPQEADMNRNPAQQYHVRKHQIGLMFNREDSVERYSYYQDDEFELARGCYETEVPVPQGRTRVWLGHNFPGTEFRVREKHSLNSRSKFSSVALDIPSNIAVRLALAQRAYSQFDSINQPISQNLGKECLTDRARNTPLIQDEERHAMMWHFWAGVTLVGILYGGLHLTAWFAPMPETARTLWRASGVIVTGTGLLWLPVVTCVVLHENWRDDESTRRGALYWTFEMCGKVCVPYFLTYAVALAMLYVAARISLVVECFLIVRHLPPSTFQVPTWSQYFPHIA